MPAGACINSPFSGPADCIDDNSLQTAKQKKLKSPQCTFPPAKYWKIPGLMVDLRIFNEDPPVKVASLRRNRTMPTDGAIAKFLYTILKQLDLKSIDWNNVASQLDITNGHAARMRFSRFRQQMEGIPPAPRKPRSAVPRPKKPKPRKPPKSESQDDDPPLVKAETEPMGGIQATVKPEPIVKEEPDHEHVNFSSAPRNSAPIGPASQQMSSQSHPFWSQEDMTSMRPPLNIKPEPGSNIHLGDLQAMSFENRPFLAKEDPDRMWPPRIIKPEPIVKMESSWDN